MNVYVYNSDTAVNIYSTEDFGSISSVVDSSVDYGSGGSLPQQTLANYSTSNLISGSANFSSSSITFDSINYAFQESFVDLGYVYDSSTLTPFGSIQISDSAALVEVESYVGSGSLVVTGTLTKGVVFTWVGNGTLFEIGSGLERTIKPYVASGTLRMDAGAAGTTALEKTTKSYNLSSVNNFQYDYGSITSTLVQYFEDYNYLDQQASLGNRFDFGLVTDTNLENSQSIYPFVPGILLGGSALPAYSPNPPENTQLFTISGGYSNLQKVSNPPENTQLFSISGTFNQNVQVYVPSITGTGTLFGIGVLTERVTWSYNLSSIYNSILSSVDYGLLFGSPIDPTNDFYDYGFVAQDATGNPDDSGLITQPLATDIPFGTINIVNGYSPQESYPWLPGPGVGRSWSYTRNGYIGVGTYTLSGISSTADINVYQGYVTSGQITISGNLVHPNIDYTPHYGIEKNIGIGTTGIQLSGFITEKNTESWVGLGTLTLSGAGVLSFTANPPEDTQLFTIFGSALEVNVDNSSTDTQLFSISGGYSDLQKISIPPTDTQLFSISGGYSDLQKVSNPPEDTQLFSISGILVENKTKSYVGLGTIGISTSGTISRLSIPPTNTQLFSVSGGYTDLAKVSNPPEDNVLYSIYGTPLVHPDIRLIPHYGIERNIGIGTTGIQISVGVGTFPDGDGNPRDAKTYSNRYGFQIGDFNLGSGIGTITFGGEGKTRSLLPYFAQGFISYYSSGNESFSRTNYNGSGITSVSGISTTAKINVYGYYGNDNNPGTSGTIFVSQQSSPIVEINVDSYLGLGTIYLGNLGYYTETDAYYGLGNISLSGKVQEAFVKPGRTNTQLFSISGSALEVDVDIPPTNTQLFSISGGITSERKSKAYEGSGQISVTGQSSTFYVPNISGTGKIRIVSRTVDHDYDTCDNTEITCDNQNSANVRFIANPVENTQLFVISGNANTSEIATYTFSGIGTYFISGGYTNIKFTSGAGETTQLFNLSGNSSSSKINSNVGIGNLVYIGGSAQSHTSQTPNNTILHIVSGVASTRKIGVYTNVGIGLFAISTSGITSKISVYTQSGAGTFNISGQLVYPDIKFIPAPKGSGLFNVVGFGSNNISRPRIGSGSIFAISSGTQSFTKSLYSGIGTIYIISVSSETINNPFQIPRTYTIII